MKKYKGLDSILLIDDEEENHFFLKLLIKKCNINVNIKSVYDGLEAIEYLTSEGKYSDIPKFAQPGIIFLDINMPRMNGWEFLEKYEYLQDNQKAKIIMAMLTSSSNRNDIKRANEIAFIKEYIVKPLTFDKLKSIIDQNFSELK